MKNLIFLIPVLSIFLFSFSREITEPDELKYVEISREMVEKKSFIVPLFNYDFYLDKGPIYFYILIFSKKIFGENIFSYIFPSQLFSILSLIFFYKILKLIETKEEEIYLSIFILFSSIQFNIMSKAIRMDIFLSFLILFGYYIFLNYLKEKKEVLKIIYGFIFSIALLTKGPVAFIWFWIVPLVYGFFEKNKKVFKFIFSATSLFFTFFVPILWLFLAYKEIGSQIFYEIFEKQTLGRISDSFAHKEPIYFYIYAIPITFFPYTFFLPFSIFSLKKNKFFFLWFITSFFSFSLISGKISIYLLPAFFPLSYFLSKFFLTAKEKIIYVLNLISITVIFLVPFIFKNFEYLSYLKKPLILITFSFFILFLKDKKKFFIFSMLSLIFMVILTANIYPFTYAISLKDLSLKYKNLVKEEKYGYSFWDVKPSFIYYSRKKFIELHYIEEVKNLLEERKYLIIRKKHYEKIKEKIGVKSKIIYEKKDRKDSFLIIFKEG